MRGWPTASASRRSSPRKTAGGSCRISTDPERRIRHLEEPGVGKKCQTLGCKGPSWALGYAKFSRLVDSSQHEETNLQTRPYRCRIPDDAASRCHDRVIASSSKMQAICYPSG